MNNIFLNYLLKNFLKTFTIFILVFYCFGVILNLFEEIEFFKNMDVNILIRSMLLENNNLYFRAGGGIVADSAPEAETLETEAKANGMLNALKAFDDV